MVLKSGVDKDNDTISKECVQMVRDKIGPVAAFKIAIVIKRLPKTRSGKILRGTIRKIADSVEYKIPPTIDDPLILDEIKADLIKNNPAIACQAKVCLKKKYPSIAIVKTPNPLHVAYTIAIGSLSITNVIK